MLNGIFAISLVIAALMVLSGCNVASDPDLPYASLPEIAVASEVSLVVSPSAPTSYLPEDPIPAGAGVQVLGRDQDSAWLLVLHDHQVGWIPSIFSGSNTARIQSALTIELPNDDCLDFLDSVVGIEEDWTSLYQGDIRVVGSVYRQGAADDFSDATLSIVSDEGANITASDYLHIPLTPDSSLVLFTFALSGVQLGESLSFELSDVGEDEIHSQAALFADSCIAPVSILPVGELRTPSGAKEAQDTESRAEGEDAPSEPSTNTIHVDSGEGAGSFYDEFDGPELDASWFWQNEERD